MIKAPENLYYTNEHLWIMQTDQGDWLAGITDYAQGLLGDVVYIDPPKIGDKLINGTPCGLVESVKTGSDLHAPLDGVVTAINQDLLNTPENINDKPYQAWIFKFTPDNAADVSKLLNAEAYIKLTDEA